MTAEEFGKLENPPSKRERLASILRLVAQESAAQNESEAWAMLKRAFEKTESFKAGERMTIYPLSSFEMVEYAGRKIYLSTYTRHILFIGQNGAIEIRLLGNEEVETKDLPHPYANLKVVMEKKGADGHFLWETPTS
ncbi:hypothetical protein C4585_03455 [Candidatus Parcubacteria bacterium]|nr:MAG: hypothetical protein C4585_03455 [Candidatus Parcubacteria bacterium]